MTDHMQTPGLPEEKPAQGCPFGHGSGVASSASATAAAAADSGDGWHDAQLDFSESMSYGDYLSLGTVLDAQHPLSPDHHEMLFIIQHPPREQMLKPHAHRADVLAEVTASLEAPSFYDEVVRLLARRGFAISPSRLERDWTQPTTHDASVEAAWLEVYRNPSQHWELYEMAEELVDLEDAFRQWRFRHVTTVERIIGFKQGTG